MATKKLGRGKGVLRRDVSSPVGLSASTAGRTGSPNVGSQHEFLECRVTDIDDVALFWAQIGTAAQLEEYDLMCLKMTAWCGERGGGMVSLPQVGNLIAVHDKTSGSWLRAKVTRQISDCVVDVFYVDTGSSARVNLSEVCNGYPPLLVSLAAQAIKSSLQGVQVEESLSARATERFSEMVQVPCGSLKAVVNVKFNQASVITLYIQYDGSWTSVADILMREGLVQYDPMGAVTISDDVVSDLMLTPSHSRMQSVSSGGDGNTPVPSETNTAVSRSSSQVSTPIALSSRILGPQTPPNTPPITPTNPPAGANDEEDIESLGSPPSLVESSVDTDSIGRKAELEDLDEVPQGSAQVLSIPFSELESKHDSSKLPPSPLADKMTAPLLQEIDYNHVSDNSSSEAATNVIQNSLPALSSTSGEMNPPSDMPLSSLTLSKPPVDSGGSADERTAALLSVVRGGEGGGDRRDNDRGKTRQQSEKKQVSDTCTEEDDDDVIEIEDESELDTSVGGREGEPEDKGTSLSADTLSSDDEWDESLLPPRPGQHSNLAVNREEIAEVEEFFRERDKRHNRKPWGQNNGQKQNGFPHQRRYFDPNKTTGGRRWGGYNSPGDAPDTNSEQRGQKWYGGVGRGRRRGGNYPPRNGGSSMTKRVGVVDVTSGPCVAETDATSRQPSQGGQGSWPEEYPRPHPPAQYQGGGIRLSQVVRKPGAGRGRGGVAVGGDSDGRQPASPPRVHVPPAHAYIRGISQSQIVKKGGSSRFFTRSSSPSEGENSSLLPLLSSSPRSEGDQQQVEGRGLVMNQRGGCGQAPPIQPPPPAFSVPYKETDRSYSQAGSGSYSQAVSGSYSQTGSGSYSQTGSGSYSQAGSGSSVYRGLTEEQVRNEVGWYTSGIERAVKKIVSSLTSATADQFATNILDLLGDSKAQKLLNFSSLRTPLEVIMLAVVSGALELDLTDNGDVINVAMEKLMDAAPHQACTFLHSSLIEKASEVSRTSGMSKRSQRFCSFLGGLFISASYSNKEEYSTAVGQAVRDCLDMWCGLGSDITDLQKVVYAECFSNLCEEIGPTIDDSCKDNLDAYFNKQVQENILNEVLSRQVRKIFLDLHTRRLNKWDGRKKVEPPSTDTPPSLETTPTTPQTPVPSTPIGDYNTPSSSIIEPVPIGTVFSGGVGTVGGGGVAAGVGDGEVPVDYGSVRLMSPQPPSAFIPAAAQHHQLGRALSLPVQQPQALPPSSNVRSNSLPGVSADDPYSPYAQVTEMLRALCLVDLMPRFEEFMIKDYILDCERDNIKSCLMEASIPMGAVIGILDYIDKRKKSKKSSGSQQRSVGALHPSNPLQMMSHSAMFSPEPPRSSAPTPAPSSYVGRFPSQPSHHQTVDVPFPLVGQTDNHGYNMAAPYQGQMKPFKAPQTPPPPLPPTMRQDSFTATVLESKQPQHQLRHATHSHHQPTPQSPLSLPPAQPSYQLPPHSQPQQQVQGGFPRSQEIQQKRSSTISLPRSNINSSGGSGSGAAAGGDVSTSPTTAQRRVSLPSPVASPRAGPPRMSQLVPAPQSSQPLKPHQEKPPSLFRGGTTVRLPRAATSESGLSSFSSSSVHLKGESFTAGGFCARCGSSAHKTPDCHNFCT